MPLKRSASVSTSEAIVMTEESKTRQLAHDVTQLSGTSLAGPIIAFCLTGLSFPNVGSNAGIAQAEVAIRHRSGESLNPKP